MAVYSSIPAWKIPWTEKPGVLQSMGHKESDITKQISMYTHTHIHTHTQSQFHSWPLGLWQLSEPHFLLNPNKAESICPGFFLGLTENPNEMRTNSTWKWKVLDQHNIASSLVSGRHIPFMSSPNGQGYHGTMPSMRCPILPCMDF